MGTTTADLAVVIDTSAGRGHLTLGVLAAGVGLAILLPVVPCALEMDALRRMAPTATQRADPGTLPTG